VPKLLAVALVAVAEETVAEEIGPCGVAREGLDDLLSGPVAVDARSR
jgi:hypothetical protein